MNQRTLQRGQTPNGPLTDDELRELVLCDRIAEVWDREGYRAVVVVERIPFQYPWTAKTAPAVRLKELWAGTRRIL